MKNLLLLAVFVSAAVLLSPADSHAQPPPRPVPIKDNRDRQARNINLFFKLPTSDVWQPASDNVRIPHEATDVKFSLLLISAGNVRNIKMKVEVRRLCETLDGEGGLNSKVTEYFTSTAPIEGTLVPVVRDRAEMIIPLATCEGCLPNNAASLVCRHKEPDRDHLGEGPYQAIITVGNESTSLQDAATPRLIYQHDFTTCPETGPCPPASLSGETSLRQGVRQRPRARTRRRR